MTLGERERAFIDAHQSAAMVTIGADGQAKVARVGVAVVNEALWSSGTQDRTRTRRLRHNPRCTLFVWDPGFAWLAVESLVTILDGPDAPDHNVALFRVMQRRPTGPLSWFGGELEEPELRARMVDEQRLVYQFEVVRTYGMY